LQALFGIRVAAVFRRRQRRVENHLAVGQIDAVLAEIVSAFRFAQSDHRQIVATLYASSYA
jgi:hypothetical protein